MADYKQIRIADLERFVVEVMKNLNVPEEDAKIVADVLIRADRRGIESHGVARLRRYVNGIKNGLMNPNPSIKIIKETPVSMVVDGDAGLGMVVTYKTMKKCIEKAKENYMCFAAIRNSNHYGIAGYYSLMALEAGMIGLSVTNAAPLVVPTFGRDAVLGTNPISFSVPANKERPFLLDMATSTVPRGKLEVYNRMGKKLPLSWATDELGKPTDDAAKVLENLKTRKGGGLLPLGGGEEETGGHKGYGLAMLVDIMSGVFSGGAFGLDVYGKKNAPPNVCHFIGAIRADTFIAPEDLKDGMDRLIRMVKNAPKREGKDRIFVHGEKEFENEERNVETVPLYVKVYEDLMALAEEFGINPLEG